MPGDRGEQLLQAVERQQGRELAPASYAGKLLCVKEVVTHFI